MPGPLSDLTVIEIAALGPVPFAGMLLADLGADVIRVDRLDTVADHQQGPPAQVVGRGRRSVAVDLKQPAAPELLLRLAEGADVLLEGFRPGVAERLGIGPEACLARNPRLVYGRMTGWGQDGPLAQTAGHDITYLAVSGALDAARRRGQRPVPPVNLLGDFGGGALYLVLGVLAALHERQTSGRGQVVDAAILDGVASLQNFILDLRAIGAWQAPPGGNLLDTGAPFYDVYTCADGKEIAVGALEPQFYDELLSLTGMDSEATRPENRMDTTRWDEARRDWAALFARRTRDEWAELLAASDACAQPVLSLDEAMRHPHVRHREIFSGIEGIEQAAPAPRFSRSTSSERRPPAWPGEHTSQVLRELGLTEDDIETARAAGAIN